MASLSEAKRRANAKWDKKNKERKAYIVKRSTAKNFILKSATKEDLEKMKEYIAEREQEL